MAESREQKTEDGIQTGARQRAGKEQAKQSKEATCATLSSRRSPSSSTSLLCLRDFLDFLAAMLAEACASEQLEESLAANLAATRKFIED